MTVSRYSRYFLSFSSISSHLYCLCIFLSSRQPLFIDNLLYTLLRIKMKGIHNLTMTTKWRYLNYTIHRFRVPTFMSLATNSPSSFKLTPSSLPNILTQLSNSISKLTHLKYGFLLIVLPLFVNILTVGKKKKIQESLLSPLFPLLTPINNPSMSPVYSTYKICPESVHFSSPFSPPLGAAGLQSPLCTFEKRSPSSGPSQPSTRMFAGKQSMVGILTST